MKMGKALVRISLVVWGLLLACIPIAGTAYAVPASQLETDKSVYRAGDAAEVRFKLSGLPGGASINSATFRLEYDPAAFELATKQISVDVVDGAIPSAAKSDSATPGTITYLVADPNTNYKVANGSVVFTVKLKVKANASPGEKTFTLRGDNKDLSTDMLDSEYHVYHISSAAVSVRISDNTNGNGNGSGNGNGGGIDNGSGIGPGGVTTPTVPTENKPDAPNPVHTVLTDHVRTVSLDNAVRGNVSGGIHQVLLDPASALSTIEAAQNGTQAISIGTNVSEAVDFLIPSSVAQSVASKLGESGSIIVASQAGSYQLPLTVLKANGGLVDGAVITLSIQPADQKLQDQLQAAASSDQITLLPGKAVTYALTITVNGQTSTVEDFGSVFVDRSMNLGDISFEPGRISVFMLLDNGRLAPAPSRLVTAPDGTAQAIIRRTGNSTYAAGFKRTRFTDLGDHWAQTAIDMLSAKGLVNGKTESAFLPDDPVTRAEFAALQVRGLGLYDKEPAGVFEDVNEGDWYRTDVLIANHEGLVTGYDGRFDPNRFISRQEMAVMVARALHYVKPDLYADAPDMTRFADMGAAADWAKESMVTAFANGIMDGTDNAHMDPLGTTTRAQAAIVLLRTLKRLELTNN